MNKIKPKRSFTPNSVPLTTDLTEVGELAINWADGIAYTRNSAGQIVSVTLGGSGGSGGSGLTWSSVPASATATGAAGSIAYDGSYLYLAPQSNTWVRAALSTWSSFTPASVTGLQLWLDASDAGSLYDATSGGSLVAADGGVARWEDKSGNARHATQATSGSRPLRKTSVQGGKDVLRFDGSNDSLSIPSSTATFKFLHSADSTVFLVFSRPIGNDQVILANFNTSSSNTGYCLYSTNGSGSSDRLMHDVAKAASDQLVVRNNTANGFLPSGFSLLSVVDRPSNATAASRSSIRRNGGAATAGNVDTNTVSTSDASENLHIAAAIASGGPLFFAGCDIAEICVYNAALSDTDRAAVESYLMTKWGIA